MARKKRDIPDFAKGVLADHKPATKRQIEQEIDQVLRDYGVDPRAQHLKIYRSQLLKALLASSPSVFELRKVGELVRLPPSIALFLKALENVREHIADDTGLYL